MSRKDMHELGEFLDEGDAALVVMAREKLSDKLAEATRHSKKVVEKEIKADQKQIEEELQKAAEAAD